MNPLYILKIGGSIATFKNRAGASVRTKLLKSIARALKHAQQKKNFDLILVHGAGSVGHQIAHRYHLKEGTGNNKTKWHAALQTRVMTQKLNSAIAEIFISEGLRVVPTQTASLVIQKDGAITSFEAETTSEALKQNCIPLLYGDMVFDVNLGMSICSGDALAPYLAKKFRAQKILFATDVDGIFDKDPYEFKNAKLIENINIKEIGKKQDIELKGSHNLDVTGGLAGKIKKITQKHDTALQSIEIFNGLEVKNFSRIFSDMKFPHTKISLR